MSSIPDEVTLETALAAVAQHGCVVGVETVPLAAADGRVLGVDLVAERRLPAHANAAVDGYALRAGDLARAGATILPLAGRRAAGDAPGVLPAGHALRVLTGAALPDEADTVVMQEVCRVADGLVTLPPGIVPGQHRREAGDELRPGERALVAGRRLTPGDLALAAALGVTALPVRRRLRVAVFSTGDEIEAPGDALRAGHITDTNRLMLMALLARLGVEASDGGILRDEGGATRKALCAASAAHDLVVTSGGVSAGEEDHVRTAIGACGTLAFTRVAIKPGRPVTLGRIGGTAVLGLPGNPVAALVAFFVLGRPLLDRLAGASPRAPVMVVARSGFAYRKRGGRCEFLRVWLETSAGGPVARLAGRGGGLAALGGSDALMVLPEAVEAVTAGDPVECLPLSGLYG